MKKRQFKRNQKRSFNTASMPPMPDMVFLGYSGEKDPSGQLEIFDSEKTPICMVQEVTEILMEELETRSVYDFKLEDWILTTEDQEGTKCYGPFLNMQEALDYGYKNMGVERFLSAPNFG